MKVAFYLENKDIQNVDFSHPELGNPGCGGTTFLFAATPYYLKKYFDSSYEVFILSNNINYLPKNIRLHTAKQSLGADFLITCKNFQEIEKFKKYKYALITKKNTDYCYEYIINRGKLIMSQDDHKLYKF